MNISIVIPCYPPHLKYLENTFNNIITQTIFPKEVILSVSETNDIAKNELYAKYNGLFTNQNINFRIANTETVCFAGMNRNRGADMASGEYIMFIDADDNIHPQKIEITKYLLDKHNPNALIHSYVINNDNNIFKSIKINYVNKNIVENQKILLDTFRGIKIRNRISEIRNNNLRLKIRIGKKYCAITHGYPTVKKTVFEKIKYTNLKRGQDALFLKDVLWELGGIVYADIALLNYNH